MAVAIKKVGSSQQQASQLRADLAYKIDLLMASQERWVTDIPGLVLVRRTVRTAPVCMTYEPGIAVIAQGRKRVDLGKSTFIYDESRFLLTSLELPIVSQVIEASEATPFLALSLKLDMSLVRELLSREDLQLSEVVVDGPAMAIAETTAELLNACCRLVDLVSAPEDIPLLSGLIQREIIYRVLRGPEGARLRRIATLGDRSHSTAKAIGWLKNNYTKPIRMEELADVARMGVSTFHHHFRALTSMSPLQYQKQLRLHADRARMMIEGLDAASAGFEVGYESASQFNREYSRFFGQPPVRDIKAMRPVMPELNAS